MLNIILRMRIPPPAQTPQTPQMTYDIPIIMQNSNFFTPLSQSCVPQTVLMENIYSEGIKWIFKYLKNAFPSFPIP